MMIITQNLRSGAVKTHDCDDKSALDALKLMRRMRWAYVKRHGRKGVRWYTVTMRNEQEWKRGSLFVDGIKVRAILGG